MSKIYCANCVFYDVECQCSRPGGLLYGIRISDAMAEAEHDCHEFKVGVYSLTEAGHLAFALKDEGIDIDFPTIKRVCDRFFQRMIDAGMLEKGETDGED